MPFSDAKGRVFQAHSVGEFAAGLGRTSHTIRRWERQGVLPPTPSEQRLRRGPARHGTAALPAAWIEGVVAIAEDEEPRRAQARVHREHKLHGPSQGAAPQAVRLTRAARHCPAARSWYEVHGPGLPVAAVDESRRRWSAWTSAT